MNKKHHISGYIAVVLLLAQVVFADIINGDFSKISGNGLYGWGSDSTFWSSTGLSNDETGSAIFPDTGVSCNSLTQQYISVSSYNYLSFQFLAPALTGGECDSFYVSIFNDTDSAIIYVWDSGSGTCTDECALGTLFTYTELDDGEILYTVQYLIDSEWKLDQISLKFCLVHDLTDEPTTLQLDNVMLTSDPVIPVPVPSAVLLVLTGIPLLRRFKKIR